jgi:hypothetical protein
MKKEAPVFLPPLHLGVFGHHLAVRCDTERTLAELSSTHARFLLDVGEEGLGEPEATLDIIDRIEEAQEMSIEDGRRRYRLFNTGHTWQFACQDRETLEYENIGFCPPRTLIQTALLTTVSSLANGRDLFHAGVVSLDGAGVVMVAPSKMGKTTLTLQLVSRGCGFLSDEIACLDPETGLLEPFPRKINLRESTRELLGLEALAEAHPERLEASSGELSVDIEEMVPGSLAGPCPLRYLLFPAGIADEPWLEPLARTNVLFRLFDHALIRLRDPAARLFRYASLLGRVECYTLVMGEPDATADLILQLQSGAAG